MKKIFILFLCNFFCLLTFGSELTYRLISGITIDNISTTDASCIADDGTATVTTSGGTDPLTYTWENTANAGTAVSTENPATGLAAGTYSVTVSDAAGCAATGTVEVGAPPAPIILAEIPTPSTCGNADGTIELWLEDSLEPFTYNWENAMTPGVNVSSDNPATDLASGLYNVTVTGNNGCTTITMVSLTELDAPEILDIAFSGSTCGQANGGAVVTVSGGMLPYTYNWENSDTPGMSVSASEVASDLPEGIYNVVVTDANGCTAFGSTTITGTPPLSFETTSIDPTCGSAMDGSAAVNAEGGSFYYTYQWSNGSTEQAALNLPGGVHVVTVTDTDGCTGTAQVELSEPESIFFESTSSNSTCSGLNDGTITVLNVSSGEGAPYLYSVDGATFSPDSIFTDLGEGFYEIYVQDVNACIALGNQVIESTTELILDYGEDVEIDFGESVDLFPTTNFSLDTALYTWTWVQDTSLIFNNFSYNPVAQPSTTTTYNVSVTDPNGCSISDAITVRVNVERDVFIPNIFSPNFDGNNDVFTVFGGIGVARVSTMQVFDRWGAKVHETSNFSPNSSEFGWDGKHKGNAAAQGVYVYYVEVEFVDGTTDTYRGDVTIVR